MTQIQTDTMTDDEVEATLSDFEAVVGALGALSGKSPVHRRLIAVHARKVLPRLRAMLTGWSAEEKAASLLWYERLQVLGTRFEPGFTAEPRIVGYNPRVRVDRAPDPARDTYVSSIAHDEKRGIGTVFRVRKARPAPSPFAGDTKRSVAAAGVTAVTSTPTTDNVSRRNPDPPVINLDRLDQPGEVRGRAAIADLAERTPPGFGSTRRP